MKYVSVDEMVRIEQESDANGHTYADMMEHAGRNLAQVIHQQYAKVVGKKRVVGLVGSGNNGGDTLVAFSYLQEWGWETVAYLVKPRPKNDPLIKRLLDAGGKLLKAEEDKGNKYIQKLLDQVELLVDGVLGTGIRLPLRGDVGKVLGVVKEIVLHKKDMLHVIAVDCPSGVDCDTGEVADETIPADVTVTMAAVKQGLLKFPAYGLIGELRVVDIGLPDGLDAYDAIRREVVDEAMVIAHLPARPLDAHKGTFGTALVVAGSVNYTGAVLLAAEAAYRSGVGLVRVGLPSVIHPIAAGVIPEATWLLLPHELGVISAEAERVLRDNLERVTAMLIGPGFGLEDATQEFLERLILPEDKKKDAGWGFVHPEQYPEKKRHSQPLPPLVIDADGLKLLARIENWYKYLPARSILTPHPGEMSVLTGLSTGEIQTDRVNIAEKYAKKWGHVVVLKGAHTVVASPDGDTAIIPVATPALARAGTGDVLAGLIAGLIAQGVDAFTAAYCGAWIHAHAGLLAAEQLGSTTSVLASDVLGAIVDIFARLSNP